MKHLKNFREVIPSLIIIAYITLLHFREPRISDAIISLGMFALFGFQSYIRNKQQPDIRKEVAEDITKLVKEINDVKAEVGKLSLSSTTGGRSGFKF
jgi:hypothetical protein